MSTRLEQKIHTTITQVLSTQLLSEILDELVKYDTWKNEMMRNHTKSKKPNSVNRDQLKLFLQAEYLRLTEASVHLQYVFLPQLKHPQQDVETPYVSQQITTDGERRIEREIDKLLVWSIKQKDVADRFHDFMTKSRSKVPVHKQDHDPVRRCSNVKCDGIALFKHTPDSLVCVVCGTKQTYLDNNIAYGEEVMWQSNHEHKKRAATSKDDVDVVTVKQLVDASDDMEIPKLYELQNVFHYGVEQMVTVDEYRRRPMDPVKTFIETDATLDNYRAKWKLKQTTGLFALTLKHVKSYLKSIKYRCSSQMMMEYAFAILQWSPPPIAPDVHKQLSQSLYLFCTALDESQQSNPDDPILSKIKKNLFRKFVLLQIIRQKKIATHLALFIVLPKPDKQFRLYETAFQHICHYIKTQKT